MDPTCDPALRSFVPVAPESHFPIQNLPFGLLRRLDDARARVGVAIGESILDLSVLAEEHLLDVPALPGDFFRTRESLNDFFAAGPQARHQVRARVSQLLRHDEGALRDNKPLRDRALFPREGATMLLPAHIENYTDFY